VSVLAGGKSCLSKELIKLLNLETLPFWLNLKLFTEVIEMLVVRDIWMSLVQPLKAGLSPAMDQVSHDFV